MRRVQHPGEGRDPEQRLPGDDQAVAGSVLREAIQPERDEEPGLREDGRSVRRARHPLRAQGDVAKTVKEMLAHKGPVRGRFRGGDQRARVPDGAERQGPARDGVGDAGVGW